MLWWRNLWNFSFSYVYYFAKNVFFHAFAVFVYSLSSSHVRLLGLLRLRCQLLSKLSIWTPAFGIRWKWRWLMDLLILTSFTNPSLRSKLTSLCFIWSFSARISTNANISLCSVRVSVAKRFTCLFGIINIWCLVYGARAGSTKKCFPSYMIFSGFSWQNGHVCHFSIFFKTVIYFIFSYGIKNYAELY